MGLAFPTASAEKMGRHTELFAAEICAQVCSRWRQSDLTLLKTGITVAQQVRTNPPGLIFIFLNHESLEDFESN